jgi:hypothetical protein
MKRTLNIALVAFIAIALIVGVSASTLASNKPTCKPGPCIATCDGGTMYYCCPIYKIIKRECTFIGWDCWWGDPC